MNNFNKLYLRVGRLIHGFTDPEHKEAIRQITSEVKEMEELIEWIIAPDRPIGSDAEMLHVIEKSAQKIMEKEGQQ